MANVLYPLGKAKLLGHATESINLINDNIKVVIVDTATYSYSAAHEYLDSIPVGERVATSGNLGTKTTTSGVFDAADVTFTGVSGDQSEAVVIYKDTGTASTSPLIAYIDTATGLPVTPGGGDIIITWDSGANKIFAI